VQRREPTARGVPAAAPAAVRAQLAGLLEPTEALLGRNLVGVYLHGSLALGCFNPVRSDLDLLIVVERPLLRDRKYGLVMDLLTRSGAPCPLELSVLALEDLHPWRHPATFQFHWSERWRACYATQVPGPAWLRWSDGAEQKPDGSPRRDPDLAAHVMMTHARGRVLLGRPIAAVFPEVPAADFIDSIVGDARAIAADPAANPVYSVLNLCRALHYLREGSIDSKAEGGAWAARMLRGEERALVRQALAAYTGLAPEPAWDAGALTEFAAAMLRRIEGAAR